jgi:hypothetical protein
MGGRGSGDYPAEEEKGEGGGGGIAPMHWEQRAPFPFRLNVCGHSGGGLHVTRYT